MPAQVQQGTPLAAALDRVIQAKIAELGWGNGGSDDAIIAEYFMVTLVNGKSLEEVAAETAELGLPSSDAMTPAMFASWLFEQAELLSRHFGASEAVPESVTNPSTNNYVIDVERDEAMDEMYGAENAVDTEMDQNGDAPALNAWVSPHRGRTREGSLILNRPTGPKAMRNGNGFRGGRERRMVGQINRVLARNQDSVLHKINGVAGNGRISRTTPGGPRHSGQPGGPMPVGRQARGNASRPASIAHGLANMPGIPGLNGGMDSGMAGMMAGLNAMHPMNGGFSPVVGQPDIMALMEQQSQMLRQMQEQLMMQQMAQNGQAQGQGRPLFERASRPGNSGRGGGPFGQPRHHQKENSYPDHSGGRPSGNKPVGSQSLLGQSQPSGMHKTDTEEAGEDVDTAQSKKEAAKPDETLCYFNMACTNKDCKFAHQSPAAPPGITVDLKDVCSFGAACKNHKCVGRHPSPANKKTFQSEQDCKFYPNCTNPHCTFRHPTMPPCRRGGECKVPNCKFTHVKTMCKFRPCTNRWCAFTHEEGQRGTFQDKVWKAEGEKEHVSERKFVSGNDAGDLVLPDEPMHEEVIV